MDFSLFPILTDIEQKLPIHVTSIGGWIHQTMMARQKGYADFHWMQVTSGRGLLQTAQCEVTVGPGQGMLMMADEPHTYGPLERPWGVKWVTFNGQHAAQLLKDLGFRRTEAFYLSHPDVTFKHMREIQSLLQHPHPTTGLEASSSLYALLLDIYRYGSRTELRSRKHQIDALAPVLRYLNEHYNRPIALEELAQILQVTPQHICVLFQQGLGVRPVEYLTRVRIRKAKELLLLQPESEVQSIAAQVGYEHASYFIKMFKRQEGLTPVMFRSVHLNPKKPPSLIKETEA